MRRDGGGEGKGRGRGDRGRGDHDDGDDDDHNDYGGNLSNCRPRVQNFSVDPQNSVQKKKYLRKTQHYRRKYYEIFGPEVLSIIFLQLQCRSDKCTVVVEKLRCYLFQVCIPTESKNLQTWWIFTNLCKDGVTMSEIRTNIFGCLS